MSVALYTVEKHYFELQSDDDGFRKPTGNKLMDLLPFTLKANGKVGIGEVLKGESATSWSERKSIGQRQVVLPKSLSTADAAERAALAVYKHIEASLDEMWPDQLRSKKAAYMMKREYYHWLKSLAPAGAALPELTAFDNLFEDAIDYDDVLGQCYRAGGT